MNRVTKHRLLPAGKLVISSARWWPRWAQLECWGWAIKPSCWRSTRLEKGCPYGPKQRQPAGSQDSCRYKITVDPKSTWIWVTFMEKWTWDMHLDAVWGYLTCRTSTSFFPICTTLSVGFRWAMRQARLELDHNAALWSYSGTDPRFDMHNEGVLIRTACFKLNWYDICPKHLL